MSLINDALKRAKDAQQKSPPFAPAPQLRPADPAPVPATGRGMGIMAQVIVILIVCGGLFLLWRDRRKSVDNPSPAKTAAATIPVAETKPPVQSITISTPSTAATPPVAAQPAVSSAVASVPEPLKLQAIVYVPGRPYAIINGKTVRAGDNVKGFRVAVINQTSATLVSVSETNVMTLEQ